MGKRKFLDWPEGFFRLSVSLRDPDKPWSSQFENSRDRTLAHEGEFTQCAYPFEFVVVAKLLCEAAGDNSRLFMKYLSKAGFLLDPENHTDPDTWGKSKKEAEGKEIQGLEA